ncbi:MAG TPA: pilus assembly protein TadG-related protein [Saliniramus sp.]|nr:pilus assembly protein TadG-related protein [Saliniramus sp.]
MQFLNRFQKDQRGATAVIFGLTLLPIMGFAGAAVDYSRASASRAAMQKAADAAAMQMVIADYKGHQIDLKQTFLANLEENVPVEGVEVTGQWLGPGLYRVDSAGLMPTTLASVFIPKMDVGVIAVAEGRYTTNRTVIERTNLSPEAADYNEIQVYCFNEARNERLGPLESEFSDKRLPFVKIADNSREGVRAPREEFDILCGNGEQMSLYFKNVRLARNNPDLRRTGETWHHYSDTTVGLNGELKYNFHHRDLVETIMCDTRAACRPQNEGGILPNGEQRNRTPAVNREKCEPGKFLAFGMEDRPPHAGGSDRDYDDIRMVINCPTQNEQPFFVRLVV